jgi:pimeloyl-ACP methyl ester carboxylesterase
MATRSIHGVEIYYEDSGGDGVPIVFSHGLLWSGRMFAAQVAALRDRHRCVSYDHRGQGRSGSSPAPYDMEQVYEDAVELLEQLKLGPCHFVGLSMGGFVGMRLAIRRPELLRSLTLIDTAGDPEPFLNVPKYKAMSLFARLFGYRPLLAPVMKIMFARPFLRDAARVELRRAQEAEILSLRQPRVEAALHSVTSRRPVLNQLGRIRTPTQVVHGAEDAAIVPARARRTCDAIPGARWVEIPRAGHTSTVEEPAAVTAALSSFIESVAGG